MLGNQFFMWTLGASGCFRALNASGAAPCEGNQSGPCRPLLQLPCSKSTALQSGFRTIGKKSDGRSDTRHKNRRWRTRANTTPTVWVGTGTGAIGTPQRMHRAARRTAGNRLAIEPIKGQGWVSDPSKCVPTALCLSWGQSFELLEWRRRVFKRWY